MAPKKLSGCQNRKRRLQREEEAKKHPRTSKHLRSSASATTSFSPDLSSAFEVEVVPPDCEVSSESNTNRGTTASTSTPSISQGKVNVEYEKETLHENCTDTLLIMNNQDERCQLFLGVKEEEKFASNANKTALISSEKEGLFNQVYIKEEVFDPESDCPSTYVEYDQDQTMENKQQEEGHKDSSCLKMEDIKTEEYFMDDPNIHNSKKPDRNDNSSLDVAENFSEGELIARWGAFDELPKTKTTKMKKKKLSGCENRKRKAAKEQEREKQRDDIKKFCKTTEASTSVSNYSDSCNEQEVTKNVDDGADKVDQDIPEHKKEELLSSDFETQNITPRTSLDASVLFNYLQDPATWPEINDEIRKLLVDCGPVRKTNIIYPEDDKQRKFSDSYYNHKMVNSEVVPRKWLVYSEISNCVFCFCCKLFVPHCKENTSLSRLITVGYSNWQNLSTTLRTHETSSAHIINYKKWNDLEYALKEKITVGAVLARIIEIIKYLCKQCLPLRGTSDILFDRNNGNFLQLLEVFAKFDATIATHLQRSIKKNQIVHYMSKDTQNEIINILSKSILENILYSVRAAKYFSIIVDCIPDISKMEQMSLIIRFVSIQEKNIGVEEHFVGFVSIVDSTGEGLTNYITTKLEELNLDIKNLRGQSYDNGANMRGKHNGVQRHILNINPRAFYVPCLAHSLNLVINDAVKINHQIVTTFGIVQEIYNFFSASIKRWDVFKKYISKLTLKPLSDTRWESQINALNPLRYQIGEIYDALFEIQEDINRDNQTKYEARVLCTKIKNYQFICSLVLWHYLLNQINIVSKMLQSKTINIAEALIAIKNLITYVRNYRLDEGFENLKQTSEELANALEIPPTFQITDMSVRKRKQTRQFDYEHEDEAIQNPEELFKINVFNVVLDTVINSLEERYEQMESHNDYFEFLYNLHKLKEFDNDTLRKNCDDLEKYLMDGEDRDISSIELFNELVTFRDIFQFSKSGNFGDPLNTLHYIYSNNLEFLCGNLCIVLRILITMPVSVASDERSLSRLKLIKTYLRSKISQERLVGLSMIAIESDICDKLDTEKIINDFATI